MVGVVAPSPDPADVLRVDRVPITHPDALLLIEEVQGEYVQRYGSRDESPIDPAHFEPPEGAFLIGYLRDVPVVSGAWRRSSVEAFGSARSAEVKRMYVVPAARGRGLARQLLACLERSAAEHGAEAMVLETGVRQPEAISLYESSGYTSIPGFGYYRHAPLSRCFARSLR